MIKKEGEKYVLYSKDGKKKLGEFGSKKAAQDREKEINAIKHAKAEVSLTITKASLLKDGTMRWQATCSDTGVDATGERTSLSLFEDWIQRAENGDGLDWLPPPRVPFLGLSHYPSLDGEGEAGTTQKMYVDGKCFKASGEFTKGNPLATALFEAVRKEMGLTKMGQTVEQPIRISAAWWDIEHSHGSFVFNRKSLSDRCPMCAEGSDGKQYLRGQLDHFAATRVPINPRTSLGLEEKSDMATTRRDDAASIVGDELADELEEQAQKMVGKSEAEQEPVLVVKGDKEMDDEDDEEEEAKHAKKKADVDPLSELAERVAALEGRLPPEGAVTVTEDTPKEAEVVEEETTETPAPEKGETDPAEVLGTSVKAAMDNEKLTREGKLESIQGALNTYAEAVKAELDTVAPPAPGEEIVTAIEKSMGALAERLDLIVAKLEQRVPAQTPPPAVPQQKSYAPTGPVQPQAKAEMPVSPITGEPSSLRALIERSVGMHQ